MNASCELISLQNATTLIGDGLHGTPEYDNLGDYYFINGNNLNNGKIQINSNTKKVNKYEYIKHKKNINDRTILVSINGTLGNIAFYNNEKVILGKSACYLNVNESINKYFVSYILQSKIFQDYIHNLATGSTIKNVSLKLMRDFKFILPSRDTQEKIVHVLHTLDKKIDLLRETNKTLESIAQAIFKSWFIDFDPVHAKQQGVECAGIDKATADLFPDSFEESEQGLIPTGWTIKQLKDIAVRHVEKIKNVVDWENEYLIDLSRIDSKTLFNIKNGLGKELTTSVTKFAKGDILFGAIRPYFHKVTLANLNGVTNISVFVIRPSVDFYHEYLASLMFRETTVDFSVRLSKGTKMPVISWSDLSTLKITLAPESIIKKYSELISPLMKKGIENSALINTLTSTRDALLPRLISGKLDLSNIEEELEGVA